jgi:tetratricopeptide (TPR) repeat protein
MPFACRLFSTVLLLSGSLISAAQPSDKADLSRAEELFKHAEYEKSLALLDKDSSKPAVQFLVGRDYFMSGDFKRSTDHLENAVAADPNNPDYQDWLGRAWGKRAETASFFSAAGFASKARQAFERSVQLDPANRDALSDLFDYYLNAPGFMGGGYDKAMKVADQMSAIDPSEGYFEKAELAQKRRQYEDAERDLKSAIAVAPHSLGHLIALAKFFARQGRTHDADAVLAQAQRVAPDAPEVWYATADIYIAQKRNLQQAKDLLERYVNAPLTADDPPRQDAMRLLRQVGGG